MPTWPAWPTPEALPDDFEDRLADLSVTTEIRTAAEQALTSAQAPATDPEDGIVYALAQLDQEALWAAHDARNAQINYEAELEAREEDTDLEAVVIEATHHEVVRCQREVDRRFCPDPGRLGARRRVTARWSVRLTRGGRADAVGRRRHGRLAARSCPARPWRSLRSRRRWRSPKAMLCLGLASTSAASTT